MIDFYSDITMSWSTVETINDLVIFHRAGLKPGSPSEIFRDKGHEIRHREGTAINSRNNRTPTAIVLLTGRVLKEICLPNLTSWRHELEKGIQTQWDTDLKLRSDTENFISKNKTGSSTLPMTSIEDNEFKRIIWRFRVPRSPHIAFFNTL